MGIFKKIFGIRRKIETPQIDFVLNDNDKHLINEFSRLDADNRIRQIMLLGDTGQLQYFKLLQYSILYDPELDVKFSALKRIHLFKEHPDLEPLLFELRSSHKGDKMEPYFSMALSRLGIITIEEFEQKINAR